MMGKRKANHVIPGMNAADAQGKGAGYNEEFSNEPLTEAQRQNNKKRKRINSFMFVSPPQAKGNAEWLAFPL